MYQPQPSEKGVGSHRKTGGSQPKGQHWSTQSNEFNRHMEGDQTGEKDSAIDTDVCTCVHLHVQMCKRVENPGLTGYPGKSNCEHRLPKRPHLENEHGR